MIFIKNYWYILLGFIVAYPLITAFMRRQEAKDKVRASKDELEALEIINSNPDLLQKELDKVTSNKALQTVAIDIYHHLGYAYPWYDPRRWSENDKIVFELLNQFSFIPDEVIHCYFIVSKGRNLRNDLQKVLDTKYYNQLVW